jgi:hypothetical protein
MRYSFDDILIDNHSQLLPKDFLGPVGYFISFKCIGINNNKKIEDDIKENPTEK